MRNPIAALALAILLTGPVSSHAQIADFTRADTLRGSDGPARAWWDVNYYDLEVRVNPADSSLEGSNRITYTVMAPGEELQIDLQSPMNLDRLVLTNDGDSVPLPLTREGNAWFGHLPEAQRVGSTHTVIAHFHGKPRVAIRPPWDGGYQWETDSQGEPWVATSNQGLGASVWWPNKDYQAEEPDSQRTVITVPAPMKAVSNGRLRSVRSNDDGTRSYEWVVSSPINNYSVSVNAGSYATWSETYMGESGPLDMTFWPLAENLDAARAQWTQARSTVACFEHWFGPYPFYADGYKLIEVPYLGMEHQSGVTYGNQYANGYLGRDLSGTGWGLQWDFIVVHESAHEWWGNNITASDIADNWIHESFANYSESLYTECLTGSAQAAEEYVIGTRSGIANRSPIIAPYGVQATPPGDMYNKGGNMLHTLRRLVDDDEHWRQVLRGLNEEFRHSLVTTSEFEAALGRAYGGNLSPFFNQYLRTTDVPVLEWHLADGILSFRWSEVVPAFAMPVRVALGDGPYAWIQPTRQWQYLELGEPAADILRVDPGFYVEDRMVAGVK